ncbi:MAG TPA: helix-turn-helix transcriptional regulator [Gemmatimonadaceae bacterium]|nr:helix-turn-helix transcriptional regulator [Gemmatimonadaceae bacterium]
MTPTLPNEPLRTPLNSLRCRPAKARIDANSSAGIERSETRREFVSLIRRAMKSADMSQKAFALNAGIPESVLSDGFNGVRNFSADWLWFQPNAFWIELRNEIDTAKGLTTDNARAIRAERIGELVRLLIQEVA